MSTTTSVEMHVEAPVNPGAGGGVQMRHIPLSRIVVPDGFNPRGEVEDDRELERMAESIRADGCLQPIRVRATEHGDYVLVAGERRYRAAAKAAVMELPAIIRPAGAGDENEHADLLIEALIENDLRRDLDALARARGYQRLIDRGLTVKGVAGAPAEHPGSRARAPADPEALRRAPAQGRSRRDPVEGRQGARAAREHPPEAGCRAAEQVLAPGDAYEAYTWSDVERSPLEVALADGELPDGVYRPHTRYLGHRVRAQRRRARRICDGRAAARPADRAGRVRRQ